MGRPRKDDKMTLNELIDFIIENPNDVEFAKNQCKGAYICYPKYTKKLKKHEDPDNIFTVTDLYEDGHYIKFIAEKSGLSIQTVNKIITKYNEQKNNAEIENHINNLGANNID